ncbi:MULTISPECIES: hypothetical protein [unclassified Bradyrhizobium]|uniref:hypothetical protein n=1 Tax=unclassified Bradyrhizobium TaxID=2631580 RepID=UPI002479B05C|nr:MULTISPECIES: hypothetical protein [unclassified Bradyrhizobium]WGR93312.1 hypothetical protein MTX20_37240 [Bradyrhizobium sp. ISRA435]WGR97847.1 hypothetical protein MTX23_26230 [Bradyrhizobium sp. ISRA436]WGS04737.1 hypothetical protein MTX18_26240 [Bradyrhizobium sp. ISRA437]WGS11618.1 hypothetical protein MTX26_26240 [Bradyrhizobium sp. ISRA443]WGS19100.1 hypothetical protein MTX22_32180 [Bradyrhizobium sp. ISRA463]
MDDKGLDATISKIVRPIERDAPSAARRYLSVGYKRATGRRIKINSALQAAALLRKGACIAQVSDIDPDDLAITNINGTATPSALSNKVCIA